MIPLSYLDPFPVKTILAFCMIIQAFCLCGQEDISSKKGCKFGLNVSYYPTTAYRFFRGGEDDPVIHGKEFYSAGITGLFSISKKLALESGIAYGKYSIKVDPWGNNNEFKEEVPVLYIPVALRYSFLKYAFATSGIFFGFDFSEPGELKNQTGIGLTLGAGFQYEFRNGIGVSLNPYVNMHSWISYQNGPFNIDNIIEGSIKLGLYYRF